MAQESCNPSLPPAGAPLDPQRVLEKRLEWLFPPHPRRGTIEAHARMVVRARTWINGLNYEEQRVRAGPEGVGRQVYLTFRENIAETEKQRLSWFETCDRLRPRLRSVVEVQGQQIIAEASAFPLTRWAWNWDQPYAVETCDERLWDPTSRASMNAWRRR